MKFKQHSYSIAFSLYFILVSVLRWRWHLDLVSLWIGGAVGFNFVYLDRFMHILLINPQEHLSEHVHHLMRQGRYRDTLRLLADRGDEQRHLLTKSILFIAIWVPLTIFVLSSTSSMFASGMVMAIALRLLLDIAQDWHNQPKLSAWLFWQIMRPVSRAETKVVVGIFILIFILCTIWLI